MCKALNIAFSQILQSIAIDVDGGPWRGPELSLEAVVTDLERDAHSHENPPENYLEEPHGVGMFVVI